jgi:hypothetical protein
MQPSEPEGHFARATARADVIGIWGGVLGFLYVGASALWEGHGMAVSVLLALAAFPLALLTCVLVPFHREIVARIASFLRPSSRAEPGQPVLAGGTEASEWVKQLESMRDDVNELRLKLRQFGETLTGYRELGEVRQEFRDVAESVAATERRVDLLSEAARLLLATQIKSVRVLSIESLLKGSPKRLANPEAPDSAAVALFVRQAEAHTKEVRELAPFWGFASAEEIDETLSRSAKDAEKAFEASCNGRAMDAAAFSSLRRYAIALAQVEAIDKGLNLRLRADLEGDGGLLTEMREAQEELEKRRRPAEARSRPAAPISPPSP